MPPAGVQQEPWATRLSGSPCTIPQPRLLSSREHSSFSLHPLHLTPGSPPEQTAHVHSLHWSPAPPAHTAREPGQGFVPAAPCWPCPHHCLGWLQRTHPGRSAPGSPAGPGALPCEMPAGLGQPVPAGGSVPRMQPPVLLHVIKRPLITCCWTRTRLACKWKPLPVPGCCLAAGPDLARPESSDRQKQTGWPLCALRWCPRAGLIESRSWVSHTAVHPRSARFHPCD